MGRRKLRDISRKERKRLLKQRREIQREIQRQRFLEKQREREKRDVRDAAIGLVVMLMFFSIVTVPTYNWFITATTTQANPTSSRFSENEALQIAFNDQNVKALINEYISKYGATPTTKVSKSSENIYVVFFYRKYPCHTENTPCLKAVIDLQRRAVTSVGPIS